MDESCSFCGEKSGTISETWYEYRFWNLCDDCRYFIAYEAGTGNPNQCPARISYSNIKLPVEGSPYR